MNSQPDYRAIRTCCSRRDGHGRWRYNASRECPIFLSAKKLDLVPLKKERVAAKKDE